MPQRSGTKRAHRPRAKRGKKKKKHGKDWIGARHCGSTYHHQSAHRPSLLHHRGVDPGGARSLAGCGRAEGGSQPAQHYQHAPRQSRLTLRARVMAATRKAHRVFDSQVQDCSRRFERNKILVLGSDDMICWLGPAPGPLLVCWAGVVSQHIQSAKMADCLLRATYKNKPLPLWRCAKPNQTL